MTGRVRLPRKIEKWLSCALVPVALLSFPLAAQEEPVEPVDLAIDQAEAIEILAEAVDHFDELKNLPDSHWIKRDQESAKDDIDALLDDVIEVLDVPGLANLRQDYRDVEEAILKEQRKISQLKEKRILAPDSDAGLLTKLTPTDTLKNLTAETRGDYDLLIEAHQANLVAYREELGRMRDRMSSALGKLGVDMPPDQLELWLSSAIGDDVVSMGVVFDSIRQLTLRLEELTQASGEDLSFAKRYYGMLVILHELVVKMQEQFITKVDGEVLPKLQGFRDEADALIAESRKLMRNGSHREVMEQNIASNELTKQAIALYERIVKSQRRKVSEALSISQSALAASKNTYHTVSLSANVAMLLREGVDTFSTLANLQVPEAAEFQNAEIREEFRRLTARLEAGGQ